jgi:signal transduction histidine kinase/pSer/pThr/pTyr-binding forkhead associated (FHA) protein
VASLFVIKGADQGMRFELDESVATLGRDAVASIQLHDSEVSRRHAEVRHQDDRFMLADLASSNGTYVNNQRVSLHELATGDQLRIGATTLLFTAPADPDIDVAGNIDIVGPLAMESQSQIIRSMSHAEGSAVLDTASGVESPWLARARSNLQVMYRTALAVSHTLDIDQLMASILDLIFEWVEASRGCILLVDAHTKQLVPRAHRNRKGVVTKDKLSISRTILDYVRQHNEGVLTSDAREDERWDPARSILHTGVREAICVPMQGRYDVVGAIYIDTTIPAERAFSGSGLRTFNEEHLKLMIAIAHQAALAIEDTSYYSAMVQAERLAAVGQMIATLSHHIKNILQGISGGSYLIEEGLNASETDVIRKGWNIVEKNQQKISNLVMDMLTFSTEREPDLVPADMNEVVRDVVELMQGRAADIGVHLTAQLVEGLPKFKFDPDALHRAILNIVTNAIDACDCVDDGAVHVSLERPAGEDLLRVVITDNGRGIPAEDIDKMFALFVSRKGGRGTGLGLPVSQKILREHGGDVRVESQVGAGSRFILELPALPITPPASRTTTDAPASGL